MHDAIFIAVLIVEFTNRFKVAILSQPAAFIKFWVAVVVTEYVVPLVHVNGVHEAILVVELVAFNFVKYNVAILSQPAALVKLAV